MTKLKLTKRSVDALQPQEKTFTVRDTELSGFSIRVHANGKRAFYYRYRVGGGRGAPIREPKIGDFGQVTVDQARNIAQDWAAAVRTGGDPMATRHQERSAPKMDTLFDRYLAEHARKRKKPSSLRNDIRMIEKCLRPHFGAMRVKDVTRQKIRSYHSSLEATPYEANRQLALLSKIFTFAADELEWINQGDHPARGVKRFQETKRRRYLSEAELAQLGEALRKAEMGELQKSISVYAVAMIRLLVLTGARHGEILKLRWDEVNFERSCLELRDSKTGAKEVFLPPAAKQLLTNVPRQPGNPYVIAGAKEGQHLVNIKDPWAIIRTAASLPDVRIHDLRHTFASLGARAGMSLPLIGALLGHRSTQTTARYAHLSDDPLRAAVETIGLGITSAFGTTKNG